MNKIYNIGNGNFNNNSGIDFSTNKKIIEKNSNINVEDIDIKKQLSGQKKESGICSTFINKIKDLRNMISLLFKKE